MSRRLLLFMRMYFFQQLTSAECQSEDQTKCFVPVAVANINFDSTLEEIVLILRPNGHHAFNNRATTLGKEVEVLLELCLILLCRGR